MRPRPEIELLVELPPAEVVRALARALKEADTVCSGGVRGSDVTLGLSEVAHRWYSPMVVLTVEPAEGGSRVHGLVGPRPNLWTFFVFIYAAQVALVIAAGMLGAVQANLAMDPVGLKVLPLPLLGLAGCCGLDLLGRRLGAGQIGLILGFIDRTLPRPRPGAEEPATP